MYKISQFSGVCATQLLRLLILHGARRRVQYYPRDASDGHPGASERTRRIHCPWPQPFWCPHLRETPDTRRVFWGSVGPWRPGELPVGSPGGYAREEQRVQVQKCGYPQDVTVPTEVRFDHGLAAKGRVERCCVAAAAGGRNMTAPVIELAGDEIPPEDLERHFERQCRAKATVRIQVPGPLVTGKPVVLCNKRMYVCLLVPHLL